MGKAETIPGWQSLLVGSTLTGVCRGVFPWTDNSGTLGIAFGTHSNLQLVYGGELIDITPTLALPLAEIGFDPLSVTNGSAVVTVTHLGHPLATGNVVVIAGATAVGGITPNGTFPVTVVDANTYTYTFTSSATGTATGGGAAVTIAPQVAFSAGQIDGAGGTGFGAGSYGIGGYGQASTAQFFPRTWSFGAWGEQLLASPRAGTIYTWDDDLGSVATPLDDAPAQVEAMVVAPNDGGYQVFALGCNEEVSGVFNPMCIRHSSVRNNTEWRTDIGTTAREYTLTGGGRIVTGRMCGPYLLVWTNDSLFIGEFVGDLDQPWKFTRVARNCGVIGPNAVVVTGQAAYWVSPDRQFYVYELGGTPTPIPCQIRETFSDNLALAQGDKIIASSTAEYSEVRFDYPDARDGYENSRYVALCIAGPDTGAWSTGESAWTARVDAGPSDYPLGANYAGNMYYLERGATADGGVRPWSITTAFLYLDENYVLDLNGVWPDFTQQEGPVTLEVTSCFYPQGPTYTTGPIPIAPGTEKVDFRLAGRLFKITLSGTGTPSFFRLGKLEFDAEQGGER